MIDEDRTMQLFEYKSTDLKPKSNKPIVAVCEKCGEYRITTPHSISKTKYKGKLCYNCSMRTNYKLKKTSEDRLGSNNPMYGMTGDKHPLYGKHKTKEQCENCKLAALKRWDNPEEHDKQKIVQQKRWTDPKEHEKTSKAGKERFKDIENRIQQSCSGLGIKRDDWKGFYKNWRDWSKAVYLNEPFTGCHRHHITETIVVCIPAELHAHIWHDLKKGTNMGEINMLALQYINGCYDE